MKLKSIVISMVAAGAVSSAAFADTTPDMQAQLDAMQAKIAQMQATINANNAGTNLPTAGWFNRISVGGMLNVDANVANRSPVTFNNNSASNLVVNNANLFIDANISDWTKAHLGAVYASQNSQFNFLRPGAFNQSEFNGNGANIDEAYLTIGNFAKSPFYLKAGKEYLPFGSYKPYQDITPSFTQILSQVNDPAAELGFVAPNGIHGNLFALQGLQKVSSNNTSVNIRNGGAGLGITNSVRDIAFDVGVQYLYNMADTTAVRYTLTSNTNLNGLNGAGVQNEYTSAVGGVAANAGIKYKAFDASMKYVGATARFNTADEIYSNASQNRGAKPQAWGADLGYSFPVRNHVSRIGVGYQGTSQAAFLFSPATDFTSGTPLNGGNVYSGDDYHMGRSRYLANYTVNLSKYTDLGVEVRHDTDYTVSNGGTNRSANTGTVRLAVKFA